MIITILLGPWHPTPPAPCGAVERRWYHVAQELVRLGHAVTIVSKSHPTLPRRETVNGVRIVRRGRYGITRSAVFNILQDLLYTLFALPLLPKSDVLVTNNVWMPAITSRIGRRRFGRVVQNVARVPKGQMKWYLRCGRLSAVSTAIAHEIVRQCPQARDIVSIVPNPIDIAAFFPAHDRPAGRTLLYTGRINPEKGLEILIDAVRRLTPRYPDLRLKIVGPQEISAGGGGAEYIRSLEKRAEGLAVEIMPPEYDRSRLADIYRSASVYIYPSVAEKGESFGVAPLEAMACGVPTIVSALECFEEFMLPEKTGLVFDHRADDPVAELERQLIRLFEAPDFARRLAQCGAERAREFSYSAIAQRYVDDWSAMLAGVPSPSWVGHSPDITGRTPSRSAAQEAP